MLGLSKSPFTVSVRGALPPGTNISAIVEEFIRLTVLPLEREIVFPPYKSMMLALVLDPRFRAFPVSPKVAESDAPVFVNVTVEPVESSKSIFINPLTLSIMFVVLEALNCQC